MNSERNEMNHKLEIAQVKLRHWSGWITAISALGENFGFERFTIFSALIICMANFEIIMIKFFTGLLGPICGIIAGPIGIRLSYANKIRQMECLLNAFICLV